MWKLKIDPIPAAVTGAALGVALCSLEIDRVTGIVAFAFFHFGFWHTMGLSLSAAVLFGGSALFRKWLDR